MRVFGLAPDSIVDGPGLRFTVFVQGCSHHCPGCHNPESQPTEGGESYTVEELANKIRANKLIHAVTLSGGEPFEQAEECAELARILKAEGYNIWAYTGYLFEDLLQKSAAAEPGNDATAAAESDNFDPVLTDSTVLGLNPTATANLLANIDVLVDGPYIESLHSFDATWRGSTNQRLLDVPASLKATAPIPWEKQ